MKKKLLVFALFAGINFSANAQIPEKKSRAVVFKFTESWCAPCGTFGWNLGNMVVDSIADNGYYVNVMGSSGDSLNANCWSPLQNNFPLTGYPSFVVNDNKISEFFVYIKDKYEKFAVTVPLASPAGYTVISGSSISVKTKTKFWSDTSGEYYLAAFLIEDKVKAKQNGQTGIVEHHYIMRGTMMADLSPWGHKLASGAIPANTEYTNNFSMALNSKWVKSNISVLLVVYKKIGDKYQLVNSMKAKNSTININEFTVQDNINVYPNPARDNFYIQIMLEQASEIMIKVYDVLGREVYNIPTTKYKQGENKVYVPTTNLPDGSYNILVVGNNSKTYKKVLVMKK